MLLMKNTLVTDVFFVENMAKLSFPMYYLVDIVVRPIYSLYIVDRIILRSRLMYSSVSIVILIRLNNSVTDFFQIHTSFRSVVRKTLFAFACWTARRVLLLRNDCSLQMILSQLFAFALQTVPISGET